MPSLTRTKVKDDKKWKQLKFCQLKWFHQFIKVQWKKISKFKKEIKDLDKEGSFASKWAAVELDCEMNELVLKTLASCKKFGVSSVQEKVE